MDVRIFRDEDIDEVNQWLEDRGEAGLSTQVLSRTGFIAEGIACGFLYATDSRICFLDFYISNPLVAKADRHAALDEVTKRLIDTAKQRGYLMVFGASSHKNIQERCTRFGFTHHGSQEVYTMELNR